MDKEFKNSPFKFLDPYQKKDNDIFFGREEEIEKLYQYVNKNRLVLVYGPSGSGKTSVIQCGLANRFEVTDWIPFFIRREQDINISFFKTLSQDRALGNCLTGDGQDQLLKALELISSRYLRPVYLIFDQFEEVLILGKKSEKKIFIENLKMIIENEKTQSCNILFSLREEYFGWLEPFEEAIPGFSDRRLRIEPMRPKEVAEVIVKSCEYFRITLEEPEKNVQQIIDIVSDKREISLPYLQVYLDQLWKDDFRRTYPDGIATKETPLLHITTKEIENFGDIRDVFERFLAERKKAIQQILKEKFPKLPDDTLNNVLDAFVTDQGTKQPVVYTRTGEKIELKENAPEFLSKLSADVLNSCLTELEANRILRDNGGSFELAHDTLAALIDQHRSQKQRRLNEIRRQIRSAYQEFSHTGEYLTVGQIRSYDESFDELGLDAEHARFFKKSKSYRRQKKNIKLASWIAAPIILLLMYFLYQIGQNANRHYALFYLGYRIDSRLDSIKDKMDALHLAKYIYDRHDVTDSDSSLIRQKFLKLFQLPEVQSKFSYFNRTIGTTNLKQEDFDISHDGSHVVLNDSSFASRYKVLNNRTGAIQYFKDISYAYFTNRPEVLLLAGINRASRPDSLYPQFRSYPNMFILYNIRTLSADTVRLTDGYLYLKEYISLGKSEYDSYRVRFTASGYLMVPFLKLSPQNNLVKMVRMYNGKGNLDLASTSSSSISKDGSAVMTGSVRGIPVIDIYDERGIRKGTLRDIYFADFTEKGSVLFIRTGILGLRSSSGDTSRRFVVDSLINYAYADGDESFAFARSSNCFYKIDLTNGSVRPFKEKLVAVNFERRVFISHTFPLFTSNLQPAPDTIFKRRLTGFGTDTFICRAGIRTVQYNKPADEILVLSNKHELFLLDNKLNVKAGFQLTWNDLYGFAKNGKAIYYVRDNSLCVFDNDSGLINLFDFDKAYGWLVANTKIKNHSREWREEHNLVFPFQLICISYNIHQSISPL